MDLDLQSEMIIFGSLLTTFEAEINDGSSLKPSEEIFSKLSLRKSVQLFEKKLI
jgi:hypothetical protein